MSVPRLKHSTGLCLLWEPKVNTDSVQGMLWKCRGSWSVSEVCVRVLEGRGAAVSGGQQVIMTRDVAVLWQVIWILTKWPVAVVVRECVDRTDGRLWLGKNTGSTGYIMCTVHGLHTSIFLIIYKYQKNDRKTQQFLFCRKVMSSSTAKPKISNEDC